MPVVVTNIDRSAQPLADELAKFGVATVREAQGLDCCRVLHEVDQQFDA